MGIFLLEVLRKKSRRNKAERRDVPPLFLLENDAVEVEKMAFTPYGQSSYQPMQMMQTGYPYQQPQQQNPLPLSGRMVTSREEALATPVDFMAGITFLPDMSHGRIYVKIFNRQTGGADVVEFAPAQPEEAKPDATEELAARVKKLEDEIAEAKRRGAINARRRAEADAD